MLLFFTRFTKRSHRTFFKYNLKQEVKIDKNTSFLITREKRLFQWTLKLSNLSHGF